LIHLQVQEKAFGPPKLSNTREKKVEGASSEGVFRHHLQGGRRVDEGKVGGEEEGLGDR